MVSVFHEQVFLVKQVVVQASWGVPVAPALVSIHCSLSFSRQVLVLVVLLDSQRNFCKTLRITSSNQRLLSAFNVRRTMVGEGDVKYVRTWTEIYKLREYKMTK